MTLRRHADILSRVAAYYAAKLAEHGPSPKGVDWKDRDSHTLRHRQFLILFGNCFDASILDLGCGFGDFLAFLRDEGYSGVYIGYDVAPAMIEAARRLHGEAPDRQWRIGAEPQETADFAIASGIFNVKGAISDDIWSRYVRDTIDTLARTSQRGFGFNILSLASDPERRRPDLYYADPADMLAYCQTRFGRDVTLLRDYGLYEFTVIVRHRGGI